jgi:hypothetical protein
MGPEQRHSKVSGRSRGRRAKASRGTGAAKEIRPRGLASAVRPTSGGQRACGLAGPFTPRAVSSPSSTALVLNLRKRGHQPGGRQPLTPRAALGAGCQVEAQEQPGADVNIARSSAGRYPARNTDARATGVLPCHRYSGGRDATARVRRGAGRRGGVAGGGAGAAVGRPEAAGRSGRAPSLF